MTIMRVPEAAMNFDYRIPFPQNDIGGTGQLLLMQTKPETGAMQQTSDFPLRPSVLRSNSGHVAASGRLRDSLRQPSA
jgi:hypothetical protein